MKPAILFFVLSLSITACDKAEPGAIDNETMARKLFAALKEDDFDKTEQLLPDKGTYRKIMKDWKKIDVAEESYDSLITASKLNFNTVKNMLPDWSETKFTNIHSETTKNGTLQFAFTTTKFEDDGAYFKFTCTTCKYNGNWFYLGDMNWIPK